jgi:hypothetical protein
MYRWIILITWKMKVSLQWTTYSSTRFYSNNATTNYTESKLLDGYNCRNGGKISYKQITIWYMKWNSEIELRQTNIIFELVKDQLIEWNRKWKTYWDRTVDSETETNWIEY